MSGNARRSATAGGGRPRRARPAPGLSFTRSRVTTTHCYARCASKLSSPDLSDAAERGSGIGPSSAVRVVLASIMRHFRNKSSSSANARNTPPPSRPSSPIVRYIQELTTANSGAKDLRALAGSSSAIALSIASPPRDPTDIALDEPGSSKESVWKAAFGAARIAVEIAKDSSDILPPLKAVMVALSVLIKNYDVGLPLASLAVDC
jgi:hypothetical protein